MIEGCADLTNHLIPYISVTLSSMALRLVSSLSFMGPLIFSYSQEIMHTITHRVLILPIFESASFQRCSVNFF
jgi:ABC-type enterochelin transport system permease subunit